MDSRALLLRSIQDAAPWLNLGQVSDLMIASADAFDAVVAALAARNAALGRYAPPPPALLERAEREGWIALPTGSISDLVPRAS